MTTMVAALNRGLERILADNPDVFLLGEDIIDPYGGAFKVTRGLSTKFPDRVLATPVSEAALVGLACGMALRGLRPIVEIMFGDFVTLAVDQLVNHASKYRWVYNNQVTVPLVVRVPMGGYRGYGATHSQSLEKMFLGVPGLRVLAINTLMDPGEVLCRAVMDPDPVLFVEHKLLYPKQVDHISDDRIDTFVVGSDGRRYPSFLLSLSGFDRPDVTVACYGYIASMVRDAALRLALDKEISCEIVVFTELAPLDLCLLEESVNRSRRLLVAEEGTTPQGWGAEISARIAEKSLAGRRARIARMGAKNVPISSSPVLETASLPSEASLCSAIADFAQEER